MQAAGYVCPNKEVRLVTLSNIVLVGVDGSSESGAALKYAVAEANRRGARLRVVSTYFPEYSVHGRTQPVTASERAIEVDLQKEIRRMVEDALAGDAPPPASGNRGRGRDLPRAC